MYGIFDAIVFVCRIAHVSKHQSGRMEKGVRDMFGIGDAIGSFFDSVFGFLGDILMVVIEWYVKYLVAPIVTAVLEFYKCIFCNMLYNISIFVLRMVDFVEMLFRSLADLPAKDMAGFKVELSLNGQTGNILLQLLKSGSVQMVFLSMCAEKDGRRPAYGR